MNKTVQVRDAPLYPDVSCCSASFVTVASHRELTQEEWIEGRRGERASEFAPPSDYGGATYAAQQPKKRGRPKKQAASSSSSPPAAKMSRLSQERAADFAKAQHQVALDAAPRPGLDLDESAVSSGDPLLEHVWSFQPETKLNAHNFGGGGGAGLSPQIPECMNNSGDDDISDHLEAELLDGDHRQLPYLSAPPKLEAPWKEMPPPRPYPLPEVATYPYTRTAMPSRLLGSATDSDGDKGAAGGGSGDAEGDVKPLQSVSLPEPTTRPLHHMPSNGTKAGPGLSGLGDSTGSDDPAAVAGLVTSQVMSQPSGDRSAAAAYGATTNGVAGGNDERLGGLELSRSETPPVSAIPTTEPLPASSAAPPPPPQPDWSGEMPMRLSVPFPMMHGQWPFPTPPGYVSSIPPLSMIIPPYSSNSMSQLLPGMACAQASGDDAAASAVVVAQPEQTAVVAVTMPTACVAAAEPAKLATKLPSFSSLFSPRVSVVAAADATAGGLREPHVVITVADVAGAMTAPPQQSVAAVVPVQVKQLVVDGGRGGVARAHQPSLAVQFGQVQSTQPMAAVILQPASSAAEQQQGGGMLTPVVTVHHQPQMSSSYLVHSPPVRPHSAPQTQNARSPQVRRSGPSPKPVPDSDPAVMERVQNILAQYRQAVTDLGEQANTPAPRRK
ncbi:PREDICTED: verprolin-like [Priapulus caudatus]|uniref:Verprolin-like n=1 Tax=Priapulus caudatus TaxID=37621 RepID=A0ABM1EY91_PRICU|nr:PREDICTED: verprolin-like [Priapulus caudatus]